MPWQKYVAARALEIDPETGCLAFREIRLTVPRQSGKTTLLFALLLHRAMQVDVFGRRQQIVYTAQTGKDARAKWIKDWVPEIEESKTLRPSARHGVLIHKATGHEGFTFPRSRSRFSLAATTKKSAHGGTLDLAFLDEAFAQADDRMEQAFKPAMITRRSPQLWVVSTAGDVDSMYLKAKVDGGRKLVERGTTSGVAYFEWSAPDDADPEDPDVWRSCMPALGHTVSEKTIRDEFESMRDGKEGVDGFRRAYLNHWVGRHRPMPISLQAWVDTTRDVAPQSRPMFFIAIEPAMRSASIAVAADGPDGVPHVELADHQPGTSWLIDRIIQLRERHPEAVIAGGARGPIQELLPELQRMGVTLELFSSAESSEACVHLQKLTEARAVTHSDDMLFGMALSGSEVRDLDQGMWTWDWKRSKGNLAPLSAATNALWLLEKHRDDTYDLLDSFG